MGTARSGRRPTSRDVAALAQVAQSTVSYVLSGSRKVAPETEKRVRAAIKELGYQPNAGARTLRTAKTNVIALMMHLDESIDAVDTAPYIRETIREARKRGYDVILSPTDDGVDELQRLASRSICDGIIILDTQVNDPRLEVARGLQVPCVFMGRIGADAGIAQVDSDTRAAALDIVDELVSTGHDQIFVIGEPERFERTFQFIGEFYSGLRERALECGCECEFLRRKAGRWEDFTQAAAPIRELWEQAPQRLRSCGIVVRTPATAEALMRYLELCGLRVGQDVSVVGYLSDEHAASYTIPITNCGADIGSICAEAVRAVVNEGSAAREISGQVLVPPTKLQRRATTVINT